MAIGSGSEGAQTALQEHYKDDMTLAEAEVLALTTLKQVMEEKVRADEGVTLCGCKGGGWPQQRVRCRCSQQVLDEFVRTARGGFP
jgi:20S proteasome alpha/beta subunit